MIFSSVRLKVSRYLDRDVSFWESFSLFGSHFLLAIPRNLYSYLKSGVMHLQSFLSIGIKDTLMPGIYVFAVNSLFWFYVADEFKKIGPNGKSTLIGDGNFQLTRLWFFSPLSLFGFRRYGVMLSFLFISIIPLLFYLSSPPNFWLSIFLFVIFYSSPVVFSMSFVVGRYHAPAWFFLIFGAFAFFSGDYLLTAFAYFVVAICSTTVLLLASLTQFWFFINGLHLISFAVLLPAYFFVCFYLLYIFYSRKSSFQQAIAQVLTTFRGIGSFTQGAKYTRQHENQFGYLDSFLTSSFLAFYLCTVVLEGYYFPLSLIAFVAYIINAKFARFADSQTVQFFLFSTCLLDIYFAELGPMFICLLLPWTFFPSLYKTGVSYFFDYLPALKPYRLSHIIKRSVNFFSELPANSRVLMAFPDPLGIYENLFSGYNYSVELAAFSAYSNSICLMPNWYMVFKYNKISDPPLWIYDLPTLSDVLINFKPTHILVESALVNPTQLGLSNPISCFIGDSPGDKFSQKVYRPENWCLYNAPSVSGPESDHSLSNLSH